jgi:3',5'-cyclic AMP phosphodiesterase CpdA
MNSDKRNRFHLLKFFALAFLTVHGCGTISADYPPGDFYLLIVSDTHISNDESKLERLGELAGRINHGIIPGITMVINTGDVISSIYKKYDEKISDLQCSRLSQAVNAFDELKVPYYWVMGNHDYKIDSDRDSDTPFEKSEILMIESIWKELTGFDPYYAVFYRGWKFIFLNSMRGRFLRRNFDDDQLDWLKTELEEQIPVLLFFHHPLETDNFRLWRFNSGLISPETEAEFYQILADHQQEIKGLFFGHGHHFMADNLFGKIPVFNTASFADDETGPFLIVGFNDSEKRIEIGKSRLY